ncbi:hypothetical protein [Conservatibacter flavescens]|uniref:Uncharacterized protein n=1 Tax=Conservatibacter flavescens TaxID=28161 RepID=A0A2M8RZC4_9PAST|nr:hypothetical protein [Conservatibacter flavescens]PJG84229.1 hypothetical protein CVP05_12355 [Conservatibacter flavescens]
MSGTLITAHLTQYALIEVAGEDAEKYLQGQLTCDVTKLPVGQSTLTANCDPKGKVVSLFRLIRVKETVFYLLMRKHFVENGLANLKKYAVFSKVTFTPIEKVWLVGVANDDTLYSDYFSVQYAPNRRIIIDTEQSNALGWAIELGDIGVAQEWDRLEIQDGIPVLAQQAFEFIPQALNLQHIEQAISFQKGCYIGQETVARAKYRGANKRAMYTLIGKTETMPTIGSELEMLLETNWRKTGSIISAVSMDGVLYVQAVLSNQLEASTQFRLPDDHTALCIQPLSYVLD